MSKDECSHLWSRSTTLFNMEHHFGHEMAKMYFNSSSRLMMSHTIIGQDVTIIFVMYVEWRFVQEYRRIKRSVIYDFLSLDTKTKRIKTIKCKEVCFHLYHLSSDFSFLYLLTYTCFNLVS
jgi:hypothetical protein